MTGTARGESGADSVEVDCLPARRLLATTRGAWLADHGHVRGVCHAPGWDRLDTAHGLGSRRVGEHMIEAPDPPPQSIAAVLADVDGTLVTSAKVVTRRAIEAIEKLHQLGVLFA